MICFFKWILNLLDIVGVCEEFSFCNKLFICFIKNYIFKFLGKDFSWNLLWISVLLGMILFWYIIEYWGFL